jgi:hypothetical protein
VNVCEHTTKMASLEFLKGISFKICSSKSDGKDEVVRDKIYIFSIINVLLYSTFAGQYQSSSYYSMDIIQQR